MVCTAIDLSEWKDFPKGLSVLLLDEDCNSAAEIKSRLEAMDYTVATFCNEEEALSAFSDKPECFHVAIVEVTVGDGNGSFKFLETAKDLPIIMISNMNCLSTMMKCIALGAMEFLHKPLSEDKLRNIWQHVVHKAFNAGSSVQSESVKPVKDSVVSTSEVKKEIEDMDNGNSDEKQEVSPADENSGQFPNSDEYPAPSTPQLKPGERLLDDVDIQDHTNCSTEKESGEQEGESKSVETSFAMAEISVQVEDTGNLTNSKIKEEDDLASGANIENVLSPCPQNSQNESNDGAEDRSKASGLNTSGVTKASRKKTKVDWTADLHRKFVQAVNQLGVDQAIPSKILELMKVEGLTRHNVASHLQKYRMHRRHILPKEDERSWPQKPKDQPRRSFYVQKPIMAYPPYHHQQHSNHGYPMWGAAVAAGNHPPPGVQMWGPPPGYSPWPPSAESWHWKSFPGMHADAWGCPVMPQPPPQLPYSCFPRNQQGYHGITLADNHCTMPQNPFQPFDIQPAEEVIDKVVKEAISKPWLPLPLGLKPPSIDSVVAELYSQGISTVPPHINNGSNSS
ncbi:Two-component response regulator-like APRR2 [Linum perenne]